LDQSGPVFDFQSALTLVAVRMDNREIMHLGVGCYHGSLIFDRIPLIVRRHSNILRSAAALQRFRQVGFANDERVDHRSAPQLLRTKEHLIADQDMLHRFRQKVPRQIISGKIEAEATFLHINSNCALVPCAKADDPMGGGTFTCSVWGRGGKCSLQERGPR